MSTETVSNLDVVTEAAKTLSVLKKRRTEAVKARDAAAWSLHVHGEAGSSPWTHTQILALFGTASHDPWTKSRKRMLHAFPAGDTPVVSDAENALRAAVATIRHTDTEARAAQDAYTSAVRDAITAGASQVAVADAAGVSRQAVNTMLSRQKAA